MTDYGLMAYYRNAIQTIAYANNTNIDGARKSAIKLAKKYNESVFIRPAGSEKRIGYLYIVDGDIFWVSYSKDLSYLLYENGKIKGYSPDIFTQRKLNKKGKRPTKRK